MNPPKDVPTESEIEENARDGVATCRLCGWSWPLDGDLTDAYIVCGDCVPTLLDLLAKVQPDG